MLIRPSIGDLEETRLIRWTDVAIGAIAYYVAVASEVAVVRLLLLSYGCIAQIFPALIAALYWRR